MAESRGGGIMRAPGLRNVNMEFILLAVIAFLLWRISDQLPDLVFRLSEIQRDIAELRRAQQREDQ
ncbi:MAG: hypothetical protein AAF648_00590 [Pseudomonadota bacterium]